MYDGTNFKTPDAQLLSLSDADRLIQRAYAQRNAAIAEALAKLFVVPILWLRRRAETARAARELLSLDDRSLDDIGISRADIHEMVYVARRAGPALRGEMLVNFVRDKIANPIRRWRLRERTRRELMQLDDAMLRDIGIERGQIEGIAAAVADANADGRELPVTAALVLGGFDMPAPANANVLARRTVGEAAD